MSATMHTAMAEMVRLSRAREALDRSVREVEQIGYTDTDLDLIRDHARRMSAALDAAFTLAEQTYQDLDAADRARILAGRYEKEIKTCIPPPCV